MNIASLRTGDKVILRRINRYGKLELKEEKIVRCIGVSCWISDGNTYNRNSGMYVKRTLTDASDADAPKNVDDKSITAWEALPVTEENLAALTEVQNGNTVAYDEGTVRAYWALERLKSMTQDDLTKEQAEGIIKLFGQPEDYVA